MNARPAFTAFRSSALRGVPLSDRNPGQQPIDPDTDIKSWARWIVGVDFGYGHPFAAALCAWVHDTDEFYVVDGFPAWNGLRRSIMSSGSPVCAAGFRIPIAWPHDGLTAERASGQSSLPKSTGASARR